MGKPGSVPCCRTPTFPRDDPSNLPHHDPTSHFPFLPCSLPHSSALVVPYLMKSLYSIQKTPSLLPWGISSWRRGSGQCGHSSDQLPFQEKRPQGFRRRSNLGEGEKSETQEGDPACSPQRTPCHSRLTKPSQHPRTNVSPTSWPQMSLSCGSGPAAAPSALPCPKGLSQVLWGRSSAGERLLRVTCLKIQLPTAASCQGGTHFSPTSIQR